MSDPAMPSTVLPFPEAQETRPTVVAPRRAYPLVLAAAAFAVMAPLVQNLTGWGLDQAEFAAQGDSTLRVEGYAFSIWGLIYAGLIAHSVRQAVPGPDASGLRARLAWPSVTALVGIGLWIVVAAMGQQIISVAVIFASLAALLVPLLSNAGRVRSATGADRWLIVWPLAALTGWLSVAAPLNLVTAATALGVVSPGVSATLWALSAALLAAATALFGAWRLRTLAYPLPVAWGLIGAFVAEQARHPLVGFFALGLALCLVVASVVIVYSLKRPETPAPEADTGAESR